MRITEASQGKKKKKKKELFQPIVGHGDNECHHSYVGSVNRRISVQASSGIPCAPNKKG
jgi:hypothetical protein